MDPAAAFEFLISHMPVGLIVWQMDSAEPVLRLVRANEAAQRLLGVSLDGQTGRALGDLFPGVPSDRVQHYSDIAGSDAAVGTIFPFPDSRGASGVMMSVRVTKMPERCVGIVFQDLAEQNAALAQREERFRMLLENSADAILLTSGQGKHLFASDSVKRILGFTPQELTERAEGLMVHPDDLAGAHATFLQLLGNPGGRVSRELRARHADGSWRNLEFVSANCLDVPSVRAIVNNFRDITERKQVEEALQKTEDQLRHAQKMEAVGRLAGGIAHDFNNLLSVVLSYADILLDGDNRADTNSELKEIRKAGLRAAELTQQLLAFSRQQVLEPQVVNLNEILSSIQGMIRRVVGEDIELRVVPTRDLWRTRVDPGQIEQVLLNLVVNARDAMRKGGALTLETDNVVLDQAYADAHVGAKAGPHVMLAVSDTGGGMDRATQDRIFDPFFTTKDKGKGTGLGLATAFGIVKQSGGSIWVYSEPGKGTTFKVYLPQTESPAGKRGSDTQPPEAPGGTETILVVEDDASVCQVTCTILRLQGYEVLEANSGTEALRLAETTPGIQLVLTDVVMPKMSGRELALQLLKKQPQLKVLYVSGYTENSIVHHGVLDEGVEFLQKPITPGALKRKVRAVLDS
jgi:two-component system, cell cycle sensor histidine kinase and response regulator CckA